GAEIGNKNNQIVIIAPLADTPAQKAGLKAGDLLLKIDNQDTQGMTISDAVSKIKGPKGTEVTLTISRPGEFDSKEFKITRDTIVIKSVSFEMKDNIAYVKISSFMDTTTSEFKKTVIDILAKNPKGIVLDLRDNPGGYLDSAVDVSSEFIEDGTILIEETKGGKQDKYSAKGDARLKDLKMVVLVNGGSASASEIVAGAMKDNKRAQIVGEKTFGKGTVQDYDQLPMGTSIKITIAKWLTPNGTSINEHGITPDIEVKLSDDDRNANRDPQLQKALELLK
ncbi:MAG: S41 family peptidase, partial [Candidatus Moranbacteria bacterium]|nr:S41 family peptidase [Candidatus Moranbacteria bacterium]